MTDASQQIPDLDVANLAKLCHEALILAALAAGPLHGYQLALDLGERSNGRFRFNHGTLYPILHRLESEGLIAGAWSDGPGRRRKQYALTAAGRSRSEALVVAWSGFTDDLFSALERKRP